MVKNDAVLTKVEAGAVDALFYQAMLDETIRLRHCLSRKERENIRFFLTEAYRQFSGKEVRIDQKDAEVELMKHLTPEELQSIGENIAEVIRQHHLQRSPDVCRKLFSYLSDVIDSWNLV